ncbi:15498_t:CDS:1 [Acaulospora colombiana]|uniref:15498_t:CDS:1 n=1 Tax=Acaulospora colombiana TaxID=27376 RepID=A0ACA9MYN4_9GLOM|nr:15498_t:CDS:1 [Acaulospora colombiana]
MLLKRTLFAAFVAFSLLALCLNATPLRRKTGDKAVVDLKKQLGGDITFTQSDETTITASGQFSEGIKENDPDNYFIEIVGLPNASFTQLGIEIEVPGTKPFSNSHAGLISLIVGKELKVSHKEDIIASGTIESSS